MDVATLAARVVAAVGSGDRDAVVGLLAEAPEPDRLAVAAAVAGLRPEAERRSAGAWRGNTWSVPPADQRWTAAYRAAEALTAAAPELRARRVWQVDLAALRLRPPSWRQAWAGAAVADGRVRPVYDAVLAGLVDRPEGPAWVLGLLAACSGSPLEALRADAELRRREVWEWFEVEGGGQDSLAAHDKYSPEESSYGHALRVLAGDGVLDRDRLLDASLAALAGDLPQFQAGWFSSFHASLAPTADERAVRHDAYVRLLHSPVGPTVAFALRALRVLRAEGRLDDDVLQAHLAPALLSRAKSSALAALALLEGCARPDPGLARVALDHPHADVQARAARLLERLGEDVDPAGLSPRLRGAAAAGDGGHPLPDVPVRREVDPLAPRDLVPLRPVADAADLADRLAVLMERADDPDELDVVLAGAVRLRDDPGLGAALGPLLRAARRRTAVHSDEEVTTRVLVAAVVVALAEPTELTDPSDPADPSDGTTTCGPHVVRVRRSSLRGTEVLELLVAGGPAPLDAPTHAGGWLDVDVLADRLAARAHVDPLETVRAVRRVPPWQAARLSAVPLGDDARVREAAAALLAPAREHRFTVGEHGAVHLVGERTSSPGSWRRHTGPADRWPYEDLAVRRLARARPGRKEDFYAQGTSRLATNRDWWEACWHHRLYLEPLLDPAEPFGTQARLLLATALATKEPGQTRLAVDVAVQAVSDGRLDAEALADGLRGAVRWAAPARLAATLPEVAGAGALQAAVVRRAVLLALPASDPAARGTSALLEALLDLCSSTGEPVDGPAREWLGRLRGASRAARAARALLALGAAPGASPDGPARTARGHAR